MLPTIVQKRSGQYVLYDRSKIESAVDRCFQEVRGEGIEIAATPSQVTDAVERLLEQRLGKLATMPEMLHIEQIQDHVEAALMALGEVDAVRHYIRYRDEHARLRSERPIPDEVREAFAADEPYFKTPLQRFQFYDKYSRWNPEKNRRETWVETVDRTVQQLRRLSQNKLADETYEDIRRGILKMEAMPSMRMLAMAGPAFERDNATQYNCTYLPVDSLEAWVEGLLLSMAGCGVGFSVERENVYKLPMIQRQTGRSFEHTVEDSAEGWGRALLVGLRSWFTGEDVTFDFSKVRPRGAILKTKGGQASGPEPLKRLLAFTRERILSRQGGSLRPIDAHDIMCSVGGAAVSGGVRRTAMISIFDEDDADMLACKDGDFETLNSQRWNANNSAVWMNVEQMDQATFIKRFLAMVESGRGEPGIFSRETAWAMIPPRRSHEYDFGVNPCGEIVLRPMGMCNLTDVVARADDTLDSLMLKVRLATIIGTIQSMGTHFPYLRPQWKKNAQEERLLGVGISGQQDCPLLTGPDGGKIMNELRWYAVEVNRVVADALGIVPSAAVTCVKPSGNSSQLVDAASGLHARWAPYYIRNVRVSASSPMARVLRDAGVPMAPENGEEDPSNPRTWVVSFPVKAPEGAITRNDRSAVEQCEYWLRNKLNWTEHNPSVTITYKPNEVLDLMAWVWEHRTLIGGMAFLPSYDAQYDQLPYIEITAEEYAARAAAFPTIDFSKIYRYEIEDRTTASQEGACLAGACDL